MVFRFLRSLLNDERVIQQTMVSWKINGNWKKLRLSESAPIRALARTIVRGGKTVQDKLSNTDMASKVEQITKLYKEEYQKALKK
ncbi:hypothetical protein Q1695_014432 [Nippostrongylus brasiliensis]|nr:hypothetical protein Q1695_014432 [Nippostrongylus brasiliensis]